MTVEEEIIKTIENLIEDRKDNKALIDMRKDFDLFPEHQVFWEDRNTRYICCARKPYLLREGKGEFMFPEKKEGVLSPTYYDLLMKTFPINWCGYVLIPENHPYYQKGKFSLEFGEEITFSGYLPQFLNKWAIGFDFAHARDIHNVHFSGVDMKVHTYKNFDYVKERCSELAKELKEKSDIAENPLNKQ